MSRRPGDGFVDLAMHAIVVYLLAGKVGWVIAGLIWIAIQLIGWVINIRADQQTSRIAREWHIPFMGK